MARGIGGYATILYMKTLQQQNLNPRVFDKSGALLEEPRSNPERVIPEQVAAQISNILSDDVARAPIFSTHSYLYIPGFSVAAKTGTTNDFKDEWIIGYSPTLAVGAWAGNNDASPMVKKHSDRVITPTWNEFMRKALPLFPKETLPSPQEENKDGIPPVLKGMWQGGNSFVVDRMSGKLATQYTPAETREERVVREFHSILYWIDKNNPRGGKPTNPENDPQFVLWKTPVRKWAQEQNLNNENISVIPRETDNLHSPEFAPVVSIISPATGGVFSKNSRAQVVVSANSKKYPLLKAEFYVNEVFAGNSFVSPFFSRSFQTILRTFQIQMN